MRLGKLWNRARITVLRSFKCRLNKCLSGKVYLNFSLNRGWTRRPPRVSSSPVFNHSVIIWFIEHLFWKENQIRPNLKLLSLCLIFTWPNLNQLPRSISQSVSHPIHPGLKIFSDEGYSKSVLLGGKERRMRKEGMWSCFMEEEQHPSKHLELLQTLYMTQFMGSIGLSSGRSFIWMDFSTDCGFALSLAKTCPAKTRISLPPEVDTRSPLCKGSAVGCRIAL